MKPLVASARTPLSPANTPDQDDGYHSDVIFGSSEEGAKILLLACCNQEGSAGQRQGQ
jgi:hypothetical protein